MPVTGREVPGILTAVPWGSSDWPARRYSPSTLAPEFRDRAGDNAGLPGSYGMREPRRSRRCRAARPTAAALLGAAALRPACRLPMGAVRTPGLAAPEAGPRAPVGNRAPIGPPDNRSASSRPIENGGYRSGAFGPELERHRGSTLGSRAASPPGARGWKERGPRALPGCLPAKLRWRGLRRTGKAAEARRTE